MFSNVFHVNWLHRGVKKGSLKGPLGLVDKRVTFKKPDNVKLWHVRVSHFSDSGLLKEF